MHKDNVSYQNSSEENHFVGCYVRLVLAVTIVHFSHHGVEKGLFLVLIPLFFRQRTDVAIALFLVGVVLADEVAGQQQERWAEDEEASDEPFNEEGDEEEALVLAFGAHPF